jgi:hypothetical protein
MPIPANNANVPITVTIGTVLAVWGSDARALCPVVVGAVALGRAVSCGVVVARAV